jgi:hypothetical protein
MTFGGAAAAGWLHSGADQLQPPPCAMMMMSFICSSRNKIGAELHIYLEEGTYNKRLLRGPSTNDMKK